MGSRDAWVVVVGDQWARREKSRQATKLTESHGGRALGEPVVATWPHIQLVWIVHVAPAMLQAARQIRDFPSSGHQHATFTRGEHLRRIERKAAGVAEATGELSIEHRSGGVRDIFEDKPSAGAHALD